MATGKQQHMEQPKGKPAMKTPPIVSAEEWEQAREQMLVKEKAFTRSRDALAAERRRMPWMAVEKQYEFEGPNGKLRLLDLFEGRPQLILYRAFFEPGVFGWPDHACRGCSFGADQVSPPRAPQRPRHHPRLRFARARSPTSRASKRAWNGTCPGTPSRKTPPSTSTSAWTSVARPQHLLPRSASAHLPHLLHQQSRRRSHGNGLWSLPRPHSPRPPGNMGRFARRLSHRSAALQVVELARRVWESGRPQVGQSARQRQRNPKAQRLDGGHGVASFLGESLRTLRLFFSAFIFALTFSMTRHQIHLEGEQ
jgi:hypothetical protein